MQKFGGSFVNKSKMKTSYIFWPCFFTFLIFFNQGFWEHKKQFLEIESQAQKPKSVLEGGLFLIPNLPPINIPKQDGPKKLDPQAGDSAQNNQPNGISTTPRQS